jgi:hypothetical protein
MKKDNSWNSLKQSIMDGIQSSVEQAEKLTRLGKLKLDLVNLRQGLERVLLKLGTRTYELLSEEKLDQLGQDEEIVEYRAQADEIYGQIATLQADRDEMKKNPESAVEGNEDDHEFV